VFGIILQRECHARGHFHPSARAELLTHLSITWLVCSKVASGQFNSVEVKKMEGEFDYIVSNLALLSMSWRDHAISIYW
jgi:hypothetical protein